MIWGIYAANSSLWSSMFELFGICFLIVCWALFWKAVCRIQAAKRFQNGRLLEVIFGIIFWDSGFAIFDNPYNENSCFKAPTNHTNLSVFLRLLLAGPLGSIFADFDRFGGRSWIDLGSPRGVFRAASWRLPGGLRAPSPSSLLTPENS